MTLTIDSTESVNQSDSSAAQTSAPELVSADLQSKVVLALSKVLAAEDILYTPEDTTPYECDGLTAYRQRPLCVVIPKTTVQVQEVLKICHEMSVPVIARGAGTGLSGGAMPSVKGVTLSMARFNQILDVDPLSRTALVQCGVRNLSISEAVSSFGLYYAPDPSSQIACTIGGNVAENSGGVHCLKYGLTLHNVLKIKGFTVSGEPIEFGSDALDAPGLDLLPLVVGSEGCLLLRLRLRSSLPPSQNWPGALWPVLMT